MNQHLFKRKIYEYLLTIKTMSCDIFNLNEFYNLCTTPCTYTRKNIYFNDFSAPSDDASIFKDPRIDAGSEPEIAIKLIENYFLNASFSLQKSSKDALDLYPGTHILIHATLYKYLRYYSYLRTSLKKINAF